MGSNDGPALKAADVGIAMGHAGTDVAREVADVVLEDDRLETMVIAIAHGRAVYANIRKSIHFLLSTNLSEILVMLAGIGLGPGQPLTPLQLLWINLLSDVFPSLALALEPPEPDILNRPPRDPDVPIVGRSDLRRIGIESAFLSAGSLGAYLLGLARYGPGPRAGTMAFLTLTDRPAPPLAELPIRAGVAIPRATPPPQPVPPRRPGGLAGPPVPGRGGAGAAEAPGGGADRTGRRGGHRRRLRAATPGERSDQTPTRGRQAMKSHFVLTSASVTEGHPDKFCDQVSDAIVDHFLRLDPYSNLVVECAVSNAILFIASRFQSSAQVDIPGVARSVIEEVGYGPGIFDGRTCSVVTSLREIPLDSS